MSRVSVRIDSPCTQSWQAMTPTERGRFCDQCQKTVVDFSGLTDTELARVLAQQTGPACGRFRKSQLDRAIPVPAPVYHSPGRLFGLLTAGLLGYIRPTESAGRRECGLRSDTGNHDCSEVAQMLVDQSQH